MAREKTVIYDKDGNVDSVRLPAQEYEQLMEDLEDLRAYIAFLESGNKGKPWKQIKVEMDGQAEESEPLLELSRSQPTLEPNAT